MITKYTTDGKKVIVVGALNAQETIVQEVFVAENGTEIPSGENFVVKSLHDVPVKSWKQDNLEKLEARYDSERREWDVKINENTRRLRAENERIYNLVASLKTYRNIEQFDPAIEMVTKFLTGQITHLVELSYSPKITEFGNAMAGGEYDRDRIKLITLFGKADGNFEWGVSEYSSGGSTTTIIPCTSLEEAVLRLKEHINAKDEKHISSYDIAASEKYGIEIDPDKRKAFLERSIESWDKTLNESIQKIDAAKSEKEALVLKLKAISK